MKQELICIIPAKGRSRRLLNKNTLNLCGKPMLAYSIETAISSKIFSRVIVSSEDVRILRIAKIYGAEVYRRKKQLADNKATVIDVCLDVLFSLEKEGNSYDIMAVLLATSPLLAAKDVINAYKKFQEKKAEFLMAITDYSNSPFWGLKEQDGYLYPYFGKKYMVKSQLLPKLYVDSGSIYFAKINALRKEKTFYGKKLVGYYISRERSIDIDEKADFIIAESIMKRVLSGEIK